MGPEEPVETINLNNIEFTIRRNLFLALAAIPYNINLAFAADQWEPSVFASDDLDHRDELNH